MAVVTSTMFAGPAAIAAECETPLLYVNTGDQRLLSFEADSTPRPTVEIESTFSYGDIALSLDGSTTYGIRYNGGWIDAIDVQTGQVNESIAIAGPAAALKDVNAAATLPDGNILVGAAYSTVMFIVDPVTGESTPWRDLADIDDSLIGTAGDFVRLPDGDQLVLAADSDDMMYSAAVVINEDGTGAIVGRVPIVYGAGRTGDVVQLVGANGIIYSLNLTDIPRTAGTSILPTITFVETKEVYNLWGAAGTQDAATASCATAGPATPATADNHAATSNAAPQLATTGFAPTSIGFGAAIAAVGAILLALGLRRRRASHTNLQ